MELLVTQLAKKFPAFYRTLRFTTVFSRTHSWYLQWARCTQSTTFHPTSIRPILILSSHLQLGLLSGLFPSRFLTKTLYAFFITLMCAAYPAHNIFLYLITPTPFGKVNRLWSSSLCSLLQLLTTSSIIGPNILLSILFSSSV